MTLAFVDVDDLKGINDRAGHLAGDRLLRESLPSLIRRADDDLYRQRGQR